MRYRKEERKISQAGFTVVELLVAIGVFAIATGIIVGVFVEALKTQRRVNDLLAVQSNASIVLEQMSREIRGGFDFNLANTGTVCAATGASDTLTFTRVRGEAITVAYVWDEYGKTITRSEDGGAPISVVADNISVRRLCFRETRLDPEVDPRRISTFLTVGPSDPNIAENIINLQTTVAARLLPCEVNDEKICPWNE